MARVCDRCGPKAAKKAVDRIVFEREGHEIDLCQDCVYEVIEFALTKPKAKKRSILSLKKEDRVIQ